MVRRNSGSRENVDNLLGYHDGYIDCADILGATNERLAQKSFKKLEAVSGYFAGRSTQPLPWVKNAQ